MYLDRAAILAVEDLPTDEVAVPEWGGTIRLRALTAAEREAWEFHAFEVDPTTGAPRIKAGVSMAASLVAACAVDAAGARLFTDADAPALARKSYAAIARCYPVASRLNGLGSQAVDDLAGNSDAGRNGASASSSPASSG